MQESQYVNSKTNLRNPVIKNEFELDIDSYSSDSHPGFNHTFVEVSSGLFPEINGYGETDDDAVEDFCDKLDALWHTTH